MDAYHEIDGTGKLSSSKIITADMHNQRRVQVLAVASGMWLGKEGPLVHVACCCANLFIKLFSNIRNNQGMKVQITTSPCRRVNVC